MISGSVAGRHPISLTVAPGLSRGLHIPGIVDVGDKAVDDTSADIGTYPSETWGTVRDVRAEMVCFHPMLVSLGTGGSGLLKFCIWDRFYLPFPTRSIMSHGQTKKPAVGKIISTNLYHYRSACYRYILYSCLVLRSREPISPQAIFVLWV